MANMFGITYQYNLWSQGWHQSFKSPLKNCNHLTCLQCGLESCWHTSFQAYPIFKFSPRQHTVKFHLFSFLGWSSCGSASLNHDPDWVTHNSHTVSLHGILSASINFYQLLSTSIYLYQSLMTSVNPRSTSFNLSQPQLTSFNICQPTSTPADIYSLWK